MSHTDLKTHTTVIFDDNEHVFWVELLIITKLWIVTKAVFVKCMKMKNLTL